MIAAPPPPPSPGQRLTTTLSVEGSLATLTVTGEIDLSTEPQLRTALDGAVDTGVPRVDVNLVGVSFCDVRGLSALVDAAEQLSVRGGVLSVRGAGASTYRLFVTAGLVGQLHAERPRSTAALLQGLSSSAGHARLRALRDEALRVVVTMVHAVVDGADGASITLRGGTGFSTVAASNDVVLGMDQDQYDTQQGPCLEAATFGHKVKTGSLRVEQRWPEFAPRARARGIETVMSTPLLQGVEPAGALNIYSRRSEAFAQHELAWAEQFATSAARLVRISDQDDTALQGQIQQALQAREVIAVAQGVLVGRDGITPDAAYVVLQRTSRLTAKPLYDVCADLIQSLAPPPAKDGGPHGRAPR